jgi:hypothetical protein
MSEEYLNYNYKMPVNKTKMKNIHLLPTDKPSRVYKHLGRELKHTVRYFEQKGLLCINQNIYITSDEEIKGDWVYYENGDLKGIYKIVNSQRPKTMVLKKIILTTDQDLIADGVQAIDDEFLEWFVKNPSCEEVEVENEKVHVGWEPDYSYEDLGIDGSKNVYHDFYKIIIPQEKPKQETILEQIDQNNPVTRGSTALVYKQETLEEAADTYAKKQYGNSCGAREERKISKEDFIAGASWQAERMYSEEKPDYEKIKQALVEMRKVPMTFVPDERMYSEEEVIELLNKLHKSPHAVMDIDVEQWFEQFKKK